jgi:PAS domain S-box-containing protein
MVTKGSGASWAAPGGEAMAVVGAHGLVSGWSEGARRLTGWAAEEVTGRPAAELIDGDVPAARRALPAFGDALVILRYRDGWRQTMALRICPLRGEDGRRGFVVGANPNPDERGLVGGAGTAAEPVRTAVGGAAATPPTALRGKRVTSSAGAPTHRGP